MSAICVSACSLGKLCHYDQLWFQQYIFKKMPLLDEIYVCENDIVAIYPVGGVKEHLSLDED